MLVGMKPRSALDLSWYAAFASSACLSRGQPKFPGGRQGAAMKPWSPAGPWPPRSSPTWDPGAARMPPVGTQPGGPSLYQVAMKLYHSQIDGPVETDRTLYHFRMARQPVAATTKLGRQPDQVVEVPIRQRLPHQRPQVFRRQQLRRTRRQTEQSHVGRHRQLLGHVPAGVVHHQHQHLPPLRVGPLRELLQRLAHQPCVDLGQKQAPVASAGRLAETIDVQRLIARPAAAGRACALERPDPQRPAPAPGGPRLRPTTPPAALAPADGGRRGRLPGTQNHLRCSSALAALG